MRILEGIEENFRFMVLEVSKQVASARSVVERPEPDRIKAIESRDDYIDNLKSVIENACWGRIHGSTDRNKRTLDLVRAANIININLERIADYAVNIVSQVQYLSDPGFIRRYNYREPFVDVDKALGLVFAALTRQDVTLALRICRAEFALDDHFKTAFDAILADLRQGESPENAISSFNIFRYLERMGDALLNIGEAVIFAALGEKLKIHQYQALQDSLELGAETPIPAGDFHSIWGTRSGCRIGRVQDDHGPRSKGVLFKEGNAVKLAREKENIERWSRLAPGLAPNIQAFQTDGDSASMLIEFLGGCNVQQLVLTADTEIIENACFLITQTVGGLWEQTLVRRPVPCDAVAQLRSRLDDVFRLHPELPADAKTLGRVVVPSLAELLAAAETAEKELVAPFAVLLHGDFNLNNLVYDHTAQRIHYIDLHRTREGDYAQDTAVFLVSSFRLPFFDLRLRGQFELVMRRFLEFARAFAAEQGDAAFEARLTLAVARALATSARFEVNRPFAQELFHRGIYLLTRVVAHAGRPWETLAFPDSVLVY
ncbi:phosphotransferase [Desulfovibrio aerotolerans]|uniref:Phosphotransferase n=1 Tax=Solidesulfovibrio aerotolerans TaxID=295255 RepID=A0A7C9IU64_9BACT|nr:PhoU domain-containing protein [Solidesulfovibrio aerotolerans]MYL83200.1 phosphotransferase [Solidesulfovibrio aerotolerans]